MKRFFIAVGVLIAVALLALAFLWGRTTVLELDQAEIQARLDPKFPLEKTYLVVVKLELSEPVVMLREGSDRVGLSVKVAVGLPGIKGQLRGTAEVSSQVRYDPSTGEFYADDPRVERLTIDGHPDRDWEKTRAAVTWVLKGVLDRTPVYTLRPKDTPHAIARLILKEVRVRNGKLNLTLGLAMAVNKTHGLFC